MKKLLVFIPLIIFLVGCSGMPKDVSPIADFDQERYLGTWYEIARLDHSFERGLSQVTAEYSLNDDGSIRVVNRGYKASSDEWKEAEGRAVFVGDSDIGHLKISFFGPFYSSYVIFALDDDYSIAYISGYNTNYLWLLARTPEVSDSEAQAFKARALKAGFDLDELIWVEHR